MNKIVIVGGGASISEGVDKGLWKFLEDKYTIGCNFSYIFLKQPTMQCFVDHKFFIENRQCLLSLPLVIGNYHNGIMQAKPDNTKLMKTTHQYDRTLKTGVYSASLCGLFTLSLAIYLGGPGSEIYLLGMDFGEKRREKFEEPVHSPEELKKVTFHDDMNTAITHFYQGQVTHRGIGKINYYNEKDRVKRSYQPYMDAKDVKIFNVSLISKIPNDMIPKISYDNFFENLKNGVVNQIDTRKEILDKLKGLMI